MKYRKLPKTDLRLSELSFGCFTLTAGQAETTKLLRKAYDQGMNYFDTADLYQNGDNETRVGKALKPIRKEVIIATKVGNQPRPDGEGWDWNPTKAYILQAAERSLKRLQTDYIDLYQLHGGTLDDPTDETIEAFEILKDKGLIRHYGLSSIRPNVIRRWTENSNLVGNMMQYSLLDRRPEGFCLEYLHQHQIGVMVRGAVAKGLLAGKEVTDYLGQGKETIERLLTTMKGITDRTLPELALNFVLHRPEITTIAVGIRTEKHLDEALLVSRTKPLSPEELEQLKNSIGALQYEKHR